MAEIIEELTLDTAPAHIIRTLTTSDGIAAWWSNHVTAQPQIGSITEVHFPNGNVFRMQVIDLEVNTRVHWRVQQSPHDWEGSTITWDVTVLPMGSKLVFGQHHLSVGPTGYSIKATRAGWHYFLASLKAYLETGKGMPYVY